MKKFKPLGIILISILIFLLLYEAFYGFIFGRLTVGYGWVRGPMALISSTVYLIGAIYFIFLLIKPDWRKIVVFIILSYLVGVEMEFPLNWQFPGGGGMLPSGVLWDGAPTFKIENLIFNLIFWYLIACLIFWIYDKFKKKS